ncbi:MAG: hypothetical protein IKT16_08140, partial [Desulfovibrio sp.]|nr:hypothetical protein [Desulfovibrio sp.]
RKGAADFGNQIVGHGSALLRPADTPGRMRKEEENVRKNLKKSRVIQKNPERGILQKSRSRFKN